MLSIRNLTNKPGRITEYKKGRLSSPFLILYIYEINVVVFL